MSHVIIIIIRMVFAHCADAFASHKKKMRRDT
jgi:hypothetical protein